MRTLPSVDNRTAAFSLAAAQAGQQSSKCVLPQGCRGSSPSELLVVLAVWVSVGKSGVTGSQRSQHGFQTTGSLKNFKV